MTHAFAKRWDGKGEARVHLLYNSNFNCRRKTYLFASYLQESKQQILLLNRVHRRCYLEHRKYT